MYSLSPTPNNVGKELAKRHSALRKQLKLSQCESKNPQKHHLLKLAKHFGVKKPELIIEQVQEAIAQWDTIAKDCDVSLKVRREIQKHLAI